jgi:isopenicillin-N N-acyltransferase-like protein
MKMANMMVADNCDILCSDVWRMSHFYHEVLGLPFHVKPDHNNTYAALDAGTLRIFLLRTAISPHPPRRSPIDDSSPPGLDSLAFRVTDLSETIAYLDGKVEWAGGLYSWSKGGVNYSFRPFYDIEGNLLYVAKPH